MPGLFAESSTEPHDERILPEGVEAGQTAARGPFHLADVEREQHLRIVFNDDPNAPETWMFTRPTEQWQIAHGHDQTRKALEWTQDQLVHVEYVRPELPDSGVNLRRLMAALDAAESAGRWFNQWYGAALAGAARSFEWFSIAIAGLGWQTETVVDPETGDVARHYFNPLTGQFTISVTPNVGEWVIDESRLDACAQKAGAAPSVQDFLKSSLPANAVPLEMVGQDPLTEANRALARVWRRYALWEYQLSDYARRLLDAATEQKLSLEETRALFQKYALPLLHEGGRLFVKEMEAALAEVNRCVSDQAAAAQPGHRGGVEVPIKILWGPVGRDELGRYLQAMMQTTHPDDWLEQLAAYVRKQENRGRSVDTELVLEAATYLSDVRFDASKALLEAELAAGYNLLECYAASLARQHFIDSFRAQLLAPGRILVGSVEMCVGVANAGWGGLAVTMHGYDVSRAGWETALTGRYAHTIFEETSTWATGSPTAGTWADAVTSMAGPMALQYGALRQANQWGAAGAPRAHAAAATQPRGPITIKIEINIPGELLEPRGPVIPRPFPGWVRPPVAPEPPPWPWWLVPPGTGGG